MSQIPGHEAGKAVTSTAADPSTPIIPPRIPWWVAIGLYVASALLLGWLAWQVRGPLDVDGAYYLLIARSLAQGRGLAIDAMWHFFHPAAGWPQPAGDLWMPLPSLLMVPGLLFGETFRHAQAVQVLLAAFLPLLAYRIAREQGASLPWAVLAGLATLFAGTVPVHWVDTDCYTAYALVGGTALYVMGRAHRDPRWLVAGGLVGGLAALTRNDGVLLLAVLWLAAILFSRRSRQRLPWRPLLLGTALFLLPVLSWGVRNMLVFGQASPAPLTFFLTMRDYRELFAYLPQSDWGAFWQQGWGSFFSLRFESLRASLTILAQDFQVWGLAPLVGALFGLRRRPGLWPALLYVLALLLVLNIFLPFLVIHGTLSRSISAFVPAGYACISLGIDRLVQRLLRWRPGLPARLVQGTFVGLSAVLLILVGLSAASVQLQAVRGHPETWHQIGDWLRQNSTADEVIMAQDPMAILLYSGRRSLGIPFEEPSRLREIARNYDVSKIVLVGRAYDLLSQPLQDLYAGAASSGPFVLLWREGEIQVYGLGGR